MDVSPPQRLNLRALSHLFQRAWVRTLLFAIFFILFLLYFRFSSTLAQKLQFLALHAALKAPEVHTSGRISSRKSQKCILLGASRPESPRNSNFWAPSAKDSPEIPASGRIPSRSVLTLLSNIISFYFSF